MISDGQQGKRKKAGIAAFINLFVARADSLGGGRFSLAERTDRIFIERMRKTQKKDE